MEKGLGVDFMRLSIWQPHGSRISARTVAFADVHHDLANNDAFSREVSRHLCTRLDFQNDACVGQTQDCC